MIIDSHVHLKHGDMNRTEYTAEEIVRTMDGAGIAKSVVFAMATTTRRSIEMARDAARKFPARLIPYVYALPHYERPVIHEIRTAISQMGFKGIKLHLGECSTAEYVAGPIFELAAEYDVPCLIDFVGRVSPCREAVATHPRTTFLIAHLGQYLSEDESLVDRFLQIAQEHPNTLLDVSGVILLSKIEDAVHRIGAERVIFGTDGPHSVQDHVSYGAPDTIEFARKEIEKIQSLELAPEEKAAILGRSVADLLKL